MLGGSWPDEAERAALGPGRARAQDGEIVGPCVNKRHRQIAFAGGRQRQRQASLAQIEVCAGIKRIVVGKGHITIARREQATDMVEAVLSSAPCERASAGGRHFDRGQAIQPGLLCDHLQLFDHRPLQSSF